MSANISTSFNPTMGADYSWIGPVITGVGDIASNVIGGKTSAPLPPPESEFPWLPISIVGGALLLGAVVMSSKRGRKVFG